MHSFSEEENFLGITEKELYDYASAKVVIQSAPYEKTSSYIEGSKFGPKAIIEASHFVEFYDEETDQEAYKKIGIATVAEMPLGDLADAAAVDLIEEQTDMHLKNGKYVVSLGAEHTVSLGFVRAFKKHHASFSVLQIDAHSDLRQSYHDNPYSHASVLARIHDLGLPICQIGIRAQCKEEADLIKSSPLINTWYAHMLQDGDAWMDECIAKLEDKVFFNAETTVRIPTNAVIPIAIIKIVRMVLNNCVLIEPSAIRIFSLVNLNIISNLSRKYDFCYKFTL